MDTAITTIDVLRHGECEDGHCYRGSTDVALSPKGWKQMERSIEYARYYDGHHNHSHENKADVAPWHVVVSSPLIRCSLFAEMIAKQYCLPVTSDQRFKEVHFGEWEGQSIKMIWQTQPQAVQAWSDNPVLSPPPGGEPVDIFADRVKAGLFDVLDQYAGQHILLVSHGGVIRALLAYCLSMPLIELQRFDVPYGCFSRLQVVYSKNQRFYRLIAHNMIPSSDEN